jgi:hypothetical protein
MRRACVGCRRHGLREEAGEMKRAGKFRREVEESGAVLDALGVSGQKAMAQFAKSASALRRSSTPYTDHVKLLGFDLKLKADRLDVVIPNDEGGDFVTNFELTAYPERGEARRLFAGKGAAKAEVVSNVDLKAFIYEREHGGTTLRDLYTEKCCRALMDMLALAAPQISKPPLRHVPELPS